MPGYTFDSDHTKATADGGPDRAAGSCAADEPVARPADVLLAAAQAVCRPTTGPPSADLLSLPDELLVRIVELAAGAAVDAAPLTAPGGRRGPLLEITATCRRLRAVGVHLVLATLKVFQAGQVGGLRARLQTQPLLQTALRRLTLNVAGRPGATTAADLVAVVPSLFGLHTICLVAYPSSHTLPMLAPGTVLSMSVRRVELALGRVHTAAWLALAAAFPAAHSLFLDGINFHALERAPAAVLPAVARLELSRVKLSDAAVAQLAAALPAVSRIFAAGVCGRRYIADLLENLHARSPLAAVFLYSCRTTSGGPVPASVLAEVTHLRVEDCDAALAIVAALASPAFAHAPLRYLRLTENYAEAYKVFYLHDTAGHGPLDALAAALADARRDVCVIANTLVYRIPYSGAAEHVLAALDADAAIV
ncbi:uncharacterized protein V1510DRAFT_403945 [Dipodascopsis tothii]|uniref:uncharacterized protein n=1 Tax=Dipodascopsis tothii TaxID=44089 RepID=UPI0034CFBC29